MSDHIHVTRGQADSETKLYGAVQTLAYMCGREKELSMAGPPGTAAFNYFLATLLNQEVLSEFKSYNENVDGGRSVLDGSI